MISYQMYQSVGSLPQPIAPLQKTNMKFTIANGNSSKACGIVHLSIEMRFSHLYKPAETDRAFKENNGQPTIIFVYTQALVL